MKILHINDTYAMTGGIARYLFEVMTLLEHSGHENIVIYQQPHPRTVLDDRRITYLVPQDSGKHTSAVAQVQHILSLARTDVAFLHAAYDPEIVSVVMNSLPTIAYIHGFHTVCPGLAKYYRRGDKVCERPFGMACVPMIYMRRCCDARNPISVSRIMRTAAEQRKAYEQVEHILVASQYMRELLEQNGVDARRITVLPYPHFPPSAASSSSPSPRRVLYAGRLEIEKGIPYLLRAIAKLDGAFELRIAGDGTLRKDYEMLARKLGIDTQVRFLGWLDDVELESEYQSCSLVVMPSIFPEPFGQVGVQALLRARPVVAFDVGGISDWLKHGEHGYLVPPLDVPALAERIDTLLRNESLAADMGAKGRAYALQAYAPENHADRLIGVFERLVEAK
jgi:glycosyltransferase involved in cell wall biosynthesis